jgi:hypothetical protein
MTARERQAQRDRQIKAQKVAPDLTWIEADGSTNVYRFAYDPESLQLHVMFWPLNASGKRSGKQSHYVYFKVPRRVFEGLMQAKSRGEYVYWIIRNGGYDNRFLYDRMA